MTGYNLYIVFVVLICLLFTQYNEAGVIKPRPFGPQEGMEYLHGVMMHNDDEAGDDHKDEDTYLRLQEQDITEKEKKEKGVGPCQGEDCIHELMHDETEGGVKHMDEGVPGAEQQDKAPGVEDAMEALHGVLMHGDEQLGTDHSKEDKEKAENEKKKDEGKEPTVKDAMEELHGVLMHGDDETGDDHAKEHDKKKQEEEKVERKPATVKDAHQFMHADGDDTKQIHDDAPKMEVGPRGVPSVEDPHEAIHGHLNAQLPLSNDDDEEEEGETKKGREGDNSDSGFLGFSFPFISDSLLDEIQLLKKKWLPKYWSSDDVPKETDHSQDKINAGDTDVLHDMASIGDTRSDDEINPGHFHSIDDLKSSGSGTNAPKHDES